MFFEYILLGVFRFYSGGARRYRRKRKKQKDEQQTYRLYYGNELTNNRLNKKSQNYLLYNKSNNEQGYEITIYI